MIYYRELKDMLYSNHLLIGGASGSGKSVIENDLIYTALFESADSLKIALVDMKRIELIRYKNTPHCIGYANNITDALSLLKSLEKVMFERYDQMAARELLKWDKDHIFIFIDEYAPLVLDKDHKRNIEKVVQNISQLGRASGIHLIVCTQYVSNVIDTRIRCNFDNKICLRCGSIADSKKMMDASGAELLPRFGEMFYCHDGYREHLQVPYITQDQINELLSKITPKKRKGLFK